MRAVISKWLESAILTFALTLCLCALSAEPAADEPGGISDAANRYAGRFCEGEGDIGFLRLIDESFAFFHAGPDVPNLTMLYQPDWDTFEEGAGWGLWWMQNSYGFCYAATPFLQEPWFSTLQRSLDLFWAWQGDGVRVGRPDFPLVAPDGSLGDCVSPAGIVYKQGDGNVAIHDWYYEGTAAGVVMQAEILLAGRDLQAMARYLPNMRRACDFIERTRNPTNNLFLVGPAANLLAPSYGGARQPDGSFGKGYLAGLSITYLAALDRMAEIYRLVGDQTQLAECGRRQKITRESLPQLLTPGGYFVKSVEPGGVRHGVLGQELFGYLEGVANADAMALRVADDATARSIYETIRNHSAMRPFDFLLSNAPGLDDTYWLWGATEPMDGFHRFGDWVNGGCWGTVEGRAILGYYRVGAFEDIRRSAERAMKWAKEFRMDEPWSQRGENSTNSWSDTGTFHVGGVSVMVDNFAIPAATIRGLFDYEYRCDRLILRPRVPRSVTTYKQKEPVRFGGKRLYLSCRNGGTRVESVTINGQPQDLVSPDAVVLMYDLVPEQAQVEIVTAGGWAVEQALPPAVPTPAAVTVPAAPQTELAESLRSPYAVLTAMDVLLAATPEASVTDRAFAREALGAINAWRDRTAVEPQGFFRPMTVEKRDAIVAFYEKAALAMFKGFDTRMAAYATSPDPAQKRVAELYRQVKIHGTIRLLASAALFSSGANQGGVNGHYPVSSNDLGEAAGTVITTAGTLVTYDASMMDINSNPFSSAVNLFDGGRAYGGKYPTTDTSASFDPNAAASVWKFGVTGCCVTPTPGATVTVTFPPRVGGYDITNIVSLSGYAYARQVQAYTVEVLFHGAAEWTALGTASGGTDGGNTEGTGYHEVQLTVTGAGGGLLASGVDAVRFTFLNTTDYGMSQAGGVSVYREIDINGFATVLPVQAAVEEYTSGTPANGSNGCFPVASADLGEASGTVVATTGTISTYGGSYTDKYGNPIEGVANLFDGGRAYGGKYATTVDAAAFDPDAASNYWTFNNTWCAITPTPGAAVTVTFPPRDGGYDITSVVSLSGWGYDRQVQAYTVAFLPHGSAVMTTPVAVSGGTDYAFGSEDNGFHEVQLTLTGVDGALLASGVDAVSFTFLNTTEYGMRQTDGVSVYREIDINGRVSNPKGMCIRAQ